MKQKRKNKPQKDTHYQFIIMHRLLTFLYINHLKNTDKQPKVNPPYLVPLAPIEITRVLLAPHLL